MRHAARAERLPARDRAAVLYADLRFYRATALYPAASRWSAMPHPIRARIWVLACRRPAATLRRWPTRLRDHDDIDRGLAEYNRIRQPVGEIIVKHSRKLGTHMGVDLQTEEDRAMHELLQDPRAMMDWIAVPNFLDAYR